MTDHRVRLTDDDIAIIVASLRARKSGTGRWARKSIERLIERLEEMTPGNPNFRLPFQDAEEATCVHGVPMTRPCEYCRVRARRSGGLSA